MNLTIFAGTRVGRSGVKCATALALCGLMAAGAAWSQDFPVKPIRLILPFPEGGGVNIVARTVGQQLAAAWGQQLVHDNRPGAGSRLGAEIAAKSPPDGYTLLMTSSSHTSGAAVYRDKLTYDPVESYEAITMVASTPLALVAHPSFPAKSVKELVALAKTRPGKLNYGSSGYGGTTHLAGELLNSVAKVKLVHVAYKGGAPALTDVLGGHIELLLFSLPGAVPQIQSGKLRALAVTSAKRAASVPDVPTVAETVPGYAVVNWYGVLAPARTPKPVVDKLHADFVAALRKPETAKALAKLGADPVGNTPAEFKEELKSEIARWSKVIKEANITPQ